MRITLTFIALSLLYSSPYAHAQGQTVQSPQVQHNVINDQPARNSRDGFYIRNTQADNFNIGHIEVDQGAKTTEHNHPAEQVMYVEKGKLQVTVAGQDYILVPGEILVIPSWVPHYFVALEASKIFEIQSPIPRPRPDR
ncbi:MAG: cupin domain-containing protein [Proteobacteria bacterium]|nr:cupin domain-containing protein [Pseudomonadota bacterium]